MREFFFHGDALFALSKAIHQTALAMLRLSTEVSLFETGIKVLDLLTPYKKGGKIGLFGGAGVGKTVVIMEFILVALFFIISGMAFSSLSYGAFRFIAFCWSR